ncbi:MAG: L-erythro-3,5-diaminohexanoate dehydrogenase [Polyangiaceae bacterium]
MSERPIEPNGDALGTHRALDASGARPAVRLLPQQAARVDNDFTRLFQGEMLIATETLNLDAASFSQMEEAARSEDPATDVDAAVAHIVLRTVATRGKQHNQVTGSGGMLLGRVLQVAPGRDGDPLVPGDRVATLVSLALTPLRIDAVREVRRASAQMDVEGEAVVFASGAVAKLPVDIPERVALAALDVAGAAPQVSRLVRPGHVVVVLGAGGKSGVLCVAAARQMGGPSACVVGVESSPRGADDLRSLRLCTAVVAADARDAVAVRRAVLDATGGREADVTISCVNVPDVEMSAILVTRDRGVVYFFAMSTSFTKAALGAEGVSKDVDLFIGNGYARGHAEDTLDLLRKSPELMALFTRRYG